MTLEEIPVPEETPARSVAHLRDDAFFLHYNQGFVRGQWVVVNVPNPLYQKADITIYLVGAVIGSVVLLLALIYLLYLLFNISLLGLLYFPAIFLGGYIPFYAVGRYGERVNRRIEKRFQREGQILQGEIFHSAGSVSSLMSPRRHTFVVKIGYRVETPTGKAVRRYVIEPRPDLEGVQLPAPGTPVYILYFNDDEHYLL